jgi:beta-glucosidase
LSYTTFAYRDVRVSADRVPVDGRVDVTVQIQNTGNRAGDEVVQMYVRHLDSRIARPHPMLRGFRRVHLSPGEIKAVRMELRGRDLAHWDAARRSFVVEKGRVELLVGGSSAAIELRREVAVA